MTPGEFLSLRSGDIVVWNDSRLRTVLVGPADGIHRCIVLPILRRSWTGRPVTCYDIGTRQMFGLTGKRRSGLASKPECLALRLAGFRLASFLAELRRQVETDERMARHWTAAGKPERARHVPARLVRMLGGVA